MDRLKRLFRERREGPVHLSPAHAVNPQSDLSRYAILVPCRKGIDLEIDRQFRQCEAMGLPVIRMGGVSEISHARSQMASACMLDGKEAILFVDSDIIFRPEDAIAILKRHEPIVAGVYCQKRFGVLNVDLDPAIKQFGFGDKGGDMEARHVGAGFLRIRYDALTTIVEHHDLPCCTASGTPLWPFFLPMVDKDETSGEWHYLGEDFAFCRRARQAGLKIIIDTRIRLFHVGDWPFGWEEAAGIKPQRLGGVTIDVFKDETKTQEATK